VEAKGLPKAIEKEVVDFLYGEIFLRFQVEWEIIIVVGEKFTSNHVWVIIDQYKFKHGITTLYHP
jgi:hypothetical protein